MATPAMDFGPVPGATAPAGPEALVGQSQKQPTDTESQNRAFAMMIRSIHTNLDDLARQYPEMQDAAAKAKKALTDGMVSKMSKAGGESANTPRIAG